MAGNSSLDFETLFSDFQELLNGSGLTVVFVYFIVFVMNPHYYHVGDLVG